MTLLAQSLIYLLAAIIAVPISRWCGFGSVLGYLAAGIVIGPSVFGLVSDPEHILHFAELGVVFLLFIVGLELQASRLWVLRRMVFGLGSAQVLLSAFVIGLLAWAFGENVQTAAVVGFILALSSTAFVLQMLAEKKQLTSTHGRAAFSILLFQDLAVIPLIALLPLLGGSAEDGAFDVSTIFVSIAILAGLIVGGRYLLRPILRIAAGTEIPEIFTATALLVVIGSALLVQTAGMSMVLGAFIAGMLLADSEYRHQLEGDIAPFKGLLLGLFFIAVGMSVNLSILIDDTARIISIVTVLMLAKALVLLPLSRLFGMCDTSGSFRLAAAMSQGGEFAFVLFSLAAQNGVIPISMSEELTLAVTLSMLLTPMLYALAERTSDKLTVASEPAYDEIVNEENEVIIAGFGRVGQIVGRLLRATNRPFTALEGDATLLDLTRRYGTKVHFGDATRLDVLRAAGAAQAKVFVIATADMEESLQIAAMIKRHFPDLTIVARARNRRHSHKLMDIGVERIFRDTLLSSVAMSESVLSVLGVSDEESQRLTTVFREKDEQLLREQFAVHDSEEKLIQSSRDTERELRALLRNDLRDS